MGGKSTKEKKIVVEEVLHREFLYGTAASDCVQHYMPPNFPMRPILNSAYVMDCSKTWKLIVTANTDRMRQYGKSGIVLFYDEFFFRLFQRDFTLEEVFPDIAKRSEVLVKAMTFMLKCSADNPKQVVNRCRYLGHRHRSFGGVRPHHWAQYTSTVIEVIMYWLGEYASPDVGAAWSNIVGFFLQHILESFLNDKVDPFESYQNSVISVVQEITASHDEESERTSAKGDPVPPSHSSAQIL
ncbi:hypothetical protein THRCLA_08879 [Thraustotheca clavata]|uniref:Globin domain-containing protein n=1 Tax=Thraustotheca clavata TaxID=74557 RepID=A0A1V9Z1D9_9STRA|nr:hypothetical protein THRCLA_08879 [Thraustotheca clavata]